MCSPLTGVVAQAPKFADATEHLLAEIGTLKLLLHAQTSRLRESQRLAVNVLREASTADERIDAILEEKSSGAAGVGTAHIAARQREVIARLQATRDSGVTFPIDRLTFHLSLNAFERNVIVACAAMELDPDFENLYSPVQNIAPHGRPTPGVLLRLFSPSPKDRIRFRRAFSPEGALMRWGIVRYAVGGEKESFLARGLQMDDRVCEYLLGQDGLDARLASARIAHGAPNMRSILIAEDLKSDLVRIAERLEGRGGVIVLHGPEGAGKRTIAAALSGLHQRPLVVVDMSRAVTDQIALTEFLFLLKRDAFLMGANLFLDDADGLSSQQLATLEQWLDGPQNLVFIASKSGPDEFRLQASELAASFCIPMPHILHRLALWQKAADRASLPIASLDLPALSEKFALTGGQIHRACRRAALLAGSPDEQVFDRGLLETAVRAQTGHNLARFGRKVESKQSWPDLILPARTAEQLRAICRARRFRRRVFENWGFGAKSASGGGLNVLFHGASGTGKTMAASILANELALDLYKVDLSCVVSKFIGETEKQLDHIFREALSSQAIVLFDEADALFGKRSEVKDAHDRYANIETAYLLQKMEEYDGVVILTSNLRNNIDDAFSRRMHHVVEFPLPDAQSRARIWASLIPGDAPVASDVDLGFLARQFELSGGHIRNAMIGAAFLAAEESSEIRMSHLVISTARELQKLGKLPSRTDFRQYFDFIEARG